MSKQSDAKSTQWYDPRPTPSTCANCAHFASERVQSEYDKRMNVRFPSLYLGLEKNLRCTIGGFAVKKMVTCAKFSAKVKK